MHSRLIVCAIVLICYVWQTQTSSCAPKNKNYVHGRKKSGLPPVILIPGVGGNQLEASINKSFMDSFICPAKSNGWINLWLNTMQMMPKVIDCWIGNIKLIYNSQTKKTTNPRGVNIRAPGWGDTSAMEYLDSNREYSYFSEIVNRLIDKHGYVRNVSLRGAPYDFRKGPDESDEFFKNLKALIEETYAINRNKSVTLIAHSMGGCMSLVFLHKQSQEWKDKYISSLVTIGTPWGGSMRALKVLAMGDDFGAFLLSAKTMREQFITNPSLGWLLPSRLFWNDSEALVETRTKSYTLADLKQYLININVPNVWEFRQNNEKYQLDFRPPGVELHCLHGENVNTVERLYYGPGVPLNGEPKLIYGDGDGSVNKRSMEGCTRWHGKQKQAVEHKTFLNAEHSAILKNEDLIDYIRGVINDAQYEKIYIKPRVTAKQMYLDL